MTSLAWKDDNILITGSITGDVMYFDIRNKTEISRITYDKHSVHGLAINNDLGQVGFSPQ